MSTRSIRPVATLVALLLLGACGNEEPTRRLPEPEETRISSADMLSYLKATTDIAADKFVQLAEAIPDESYDWRPMDGVRSFREIFVHVAADNWYGGALMGIATPDDIAVTDRDETVRAYQNRHLSKAETLIHLRRSFDFLADAQDQTRDRLDTPARLRTTELTYGDLWVRLTSHMHEHLGQGIAYTRANGIVPPWSR